MAILNRLESGSLWESTKLRFRFCLPMQPAFFTASLQEIWKKYAYIVGYSGVTTASRMAIGAIRLNWETPALYQAAADEMQLLAKAYGIESGENFGEKTAKQAFDLPEQATSSMHQDFCKGLRLEVEHLQGAALRLAEKKDLDLPITRTLYR